MHMRITEGVTLIMLSLEAAAVSALAKPFDLILSKDVWCRRNELVALDLVITAVSTMFAFVAMIGTTPAYLSDFSSCCRRQSCCYQSVLLLVRSE